MTDNTILQIVTMVTAAITTLGLAYIRARFSALESKIAALEKTLVSINMIVGQSKGDPILSLKAVLHQLESAQFSVIDKDSVG